MKLSTLAGIVAGLAAIFGAFLWQGGTFGALFLFPAMLIVFGGTFAAAIAGASFKQFALLPKLLYISIFPKKYNKEEIINQIIVFAGIARREGILAIEKKLGSVKHPFLRKLFQICIDGADPDTLQKIVESEITYISERHHANINIFVKMGGYSPTMGIIGTVMGLIAALAAAGEDPAVLIRHIGSAFIATMWGILMANIVWLPVGDKLKALHNDEILLLQLMLDGVYSVQLGESPSVIRAKLASAFPLSEQDEIMKKSKENFDKQFARRYEIQPEAPKPPDVVEKTEINEAKKEGNSSNKKQP